MQITTGSYLSSQQERIWYLQRGQIHYRVQCAILLSGHIDTTILEKAFFTLLEQHEILRTVFSIVPGLDVPMQVVLDNFQVSYPYCDLTALSESEQTGQRDAIFQALYERDIDLAQGPLLDIFLCQLASDRHVLFLRLPALCADMTTLNLLVQHLGAIYRAYQEQRLIDERYAEPLQYADVAAWQHDLLREPEAASQKERWHQLALPLPNKDLPFQRPVTRTLNSELYPLEICPLRLALPLDRETHAALVSLNNTSPITFSAVLITCWQVLLARLTHHNSQCCGVACSGRHYEELETASGPYTRFVPISLTVEMTQEFAQARQDIERLLADALKWQEYFSWDSISSGDHRMHPPTFSTIFACDTWATYTVTPSLQCSLLRQQGYSEPFSLCLHALINDQTIELSLQASHHDYDLPELARLGNALMALLRDAITSSHRNIGQLALITANERQRVLDILTQNQINFPPLSFPELFDRQAKRSPSLPAVVCGDQQRTYEQLALQTHQLAHWLQAQGVGSNVIVGICLERSVNMLVALLGILKAGGAYLPLDPEHPPARLIAQLAQSQASLLITQASLAGRFSEWTGEVTAIEDLENTLVLQPSLPPARYPSLEDLAYVIYTSGSTGQPKGVAINHGNVSNYIHAMSRLLSASGLLSASEGMHFATVSTLAADLGNTSIFCALANGGCLHMLRYETITSGAALARYVTTHPLDVLKIVPSHLQTLLASTPDPGKLLPRTHLILGGEACTWQLIRQLQSSGGNCRVINHYGPTEATIGSLVYNLGSLDHLDWSEEPRTTTVPIGCPIPNVQVFLLDDQQQPVAVGAPGEIYLGGAGLSVGYLHDQERTQQSFLTLALPGLPLQRLYRTGDMGRMTLGNRMQFLGRKDQQIKLRGHRIELKEIEGILRAHVQVRECVIVFRQVPDEEPQLVAYVVGNAEEPELDGRVLKDYLATQLPPVMVPSTYIMLSRLPLTINGKVDYSQLPPPSLAEDSAPGTFQGPRTPVEEVLLGIWQGLLKRNAISIHNSFFDLGGHSLLATQVIARIQKFLGIDVPILTLFDTPTIAGLASSIEQRLRTEIQLEQPPLVSSPRTEAIPLSFAQQRLWFLQQLEPESRAYLKSATFQLKGSLNVGALVRSLQEIVQRHEILRTAFIAHHGRPVQRISSHTCLLLPFVDLSALTYEQARGEAQRLVQLEAECLFDLTQPALLRGFLLRLRFNEHYLQLTTHHIASDGWSNSIVLRELSILYSAFQRELPSPLEPLPVQYADYAIWQHQWLQGEVLNAHIHYWRRKLAGAQPLQLPTDTSVISSRTNSGESYTFQFSARLSRDLVALSQREGVTLFMTVLTAFQILLFQYSGQADSVIGTDVANRTQEELEHLIGFFINLLVIRTHLKPSAPFLDLLGQVRKTVLEAYMHQDAPFDLLVDVLGLNRSSTSIPLVRALMVLQNVPEHTLHLPELDVQVTTSGTAAAKFDLAVFLSEETDGLYGTVEYKPDLFRPQTISTLIKRFAELLQRIVDNPDATIESLNSFNDDEMINKQNKRREAIQLNRQALQTSKRVEVDLPFGQ